jgi:carbonic anhydrase/acetyltransferase-like protein (isoleucine patch superfamily)
MIILSYKGSTPKIARGCFVAQSATLVGDIAVDDESSIWFGVSIRADSGPIRIGKRVNVQDNCVIHTDAGGECVIGDCVSVGHSAVIHGATIGENSLIGMGAILLNGSKIGKNSVIGAGSLVTQRTEFPDDCLVLGSPATVKRKLSQDEIKGIAANANSYDQLRIEYLAMAKNTG